ncbi:MAG TPA: hypothetical protein VLN45_07195 [Ignavibacteriaceae bacterium]|nr:hypothetical protein [Ignavibacteriaceae bacterium]
MNKIIVQIGLLVFFPGVLFFTRMGLSLQDILIRLIIASLVLIILLSVIELIFLKSANKCNQELITNFQKILRFRQNREESQLGNNYG